MALSQQFAERAQSNQRKTVLSKDRVRRLSTWHVSTERAPRFPTLSVSAEDLCGLFADQRLRADPNSHELSAIADTAEMERSIGVLFALLVARQFKGDHAVEDLSVSQPAELLSHPEHAVGGSADATKLSGPHARNNYPRRDS